MINKLKYYISDSVDPYENLATEKYLFDSVGHDECILYLWQNENTVVIGRNQNPWLECQCSLLKAEGGKLARRLSGGGAVFHDLGNLNFTFLCPQDNYNLDRHIKVIKTACTLSGIVTEVSGRNDILANGRKFSGNAFYNSKGKAYHHGTLLVSADLEGMQKYLTPPKGKITAKGIKSVRSRVINLSELSASLNIENMKKYMLEAFNKVYSLEAAPVEITDSEKICELKEKYSSWDYLFGSPLPFTFSCEKYFSWGHINLQLEISEGLIKASRVYTDSMDWSLSEVVQSALAHCKFDFACVSNALKDKLPNNIAEDFINMIKEQISF